MLELLSTIVSMVLGGGLRLLPEFLKLWNRKTDYAHEIAMLDKQMQLEKFRHENNIEDITVQGDINLALKTLDVHAEALRGQMQITKIKWVDALNFSFRPVSSYYLLALYGLAKLAMFVLAYQAGYNTWETVLQVYDKQDRDLLAGVFMFWFVGRVFDSKK